MVPNVGYDGDYVHIGLWVSRRAWETVREFLKLGWPYSGARLDLNQHARLHEQGILSPRVYRSTTAARARRVYRTPSSNDTADSVSSD